MAQHIHCSVSNCHYWSQGNVCKASEIIVTSDSKAVDLPDQVDAKMAAQFQETPTGSCMETCCKTFVAKDAPEKSVDGIMKQS